MNEEIKLIKKYYSKGETRGGRDKWILDKIEECNITLEKYYRLVKNKNPFGDERQRKSYTNIGYVVTYIVCTSPDKKNRIIYDFYIE